jgi:hypothetical protein
MDEKFFKDKDEDFNLNGDDVMTLVIRLWYHQN